VVTAGWAPVLVTAAIPARPALPVLAGVPWLVIAGVYTAFCGWSYRDLLTIGAGQPSPEVPDISNLPPAA
jgi:hypothetical protein